MKYYIIRLYEEEKDKTWKHTKKMIPKYSKVDKQKLRKCRKNIIYCMSQKQLQQQVEQLREHMEELLKGLKS